MALNPFFLQGSKGEQNLIQDLVNEHIKMHGIEFIYMPRVYVTSKDVMREVVDSKFDRSFPIEGYIESFEGFDSGYNLLTKFGVRSTAEMNVIISQEAYANGIAPLLWKFPGREVGPTGRPENQERPYEGDLLYFPLRDIIFEIKYVNDLVEFYQLQKNYTYRLTLEPFEYSDETIDTGISDIDDDFETAGYNVTMTLGDEGNKATMFTTLTNGGIFKIEMIEGGSGYTNAPTVKIEPPVGEGVAAEAVAITTHTGTRNFKSLMVQRIEITNPGAGYVVGIDDPTIQFLTEDGKGSGAKGKAGIGTAGVVGIVTVSFVGSNYATPPTITFDEPDVGGTRATATAKLNASNQVGSVQITNAGFGYTVVPTITVGASSSVGSGTFLYGEMITGASSLTTAFVSKWDTSTNTLLAKNLSGEFAVGEIISNVGFGSAQYVLNSIDYEDDDPYNTGDTIEVRADSSILDFTERNPFGEV
tara:strand:+ start:1436 stop:2857 length:1422 start_codon:yes stop_codon:yes gene_type:complete